MSEWRVPLSDIDLGAEEQEVVSRILSSRWLSMGPWTERFEQAFAAYLGIDHAVAVSSGTAALHLACRVLGIRSGDEVILPSLTFVATANAVLYCGGRPVFADIHGPSDLNVSAEEILARVTPKTRAITVMHYGGFPCDLTAIREIAEDHHLVLIEDAAHAAGAKYKGIKCGTVGEIGCFSFYANKNLVTGEGGMVVTQDRQVADRLRILRSHGMTRATWERHQGPEYHYDVIDLGYNYRMNEIAAGIGTVQLKHLDRNNQRRKDRTERYRRLLEPCPEIGIPFRNTPGHSSYHLLPVLVAPHISRDQVIRDLREEGIQTSVHYPPIHRFSYYRELFGPRSERLPATEYAGDHELTLPLFPGMGDDQIDIVVDNLIRALDRQENRRT